MPRWLALVPVFLLAHAAPARADLIDLGKGLIYDSVQNLTWLQDTMYSRTSGSDADGLMTYDEAVAWLDGLVYAGYDDWHLARRTPVMGPIHDAIGIGGSEISGVMFQLGWQWVHTGPTEDFYSWDYVPGAAGAGPFTNFEVTQSGQFYFNQTWVVGRRVWSTTRDVDLPDGFAAEARVWAVRDGNPLARVPEPSTLLMLTFGALGSLSLRRRHTRA